MSGLMERHLRLEQFLDNYWRMIFPARVTPSTKVMNLLEVIYPKLNWKNIRFYQGLPWFTRFVAPYVTAQALPATYSFRKLNIHVSQYSEDNTTALAEIVHEAYHMMQYERFAKGYGIGYLRGFIVYYNACYITRGYRNNPFEIPAYEQGYAFERFCDMHNLSKSDAHRKELLEKLVKETKLKTEQIEFRFEGKKHHLALSFLFALLITTTKPLVELVLLANYAVLKSVSRIMKFTHLLFSQSRKAL